MERQKQQGGCPPAAPRAVRKASEPDVPPAKDGWLGQTTKKIKQKAKSMADDFIDYAKRTDL